MKKSLIVFLSLFTVVSFIGCMGGGGGGGGGGGIPITGAPLETSTQTTTTTTTIPVPTVITQVGIATDPSFLARTSNMGPANRQSIADAVYRLTERLYVKKTTDNLEIIFSYILEERKKCLDIIVLHPDIPAIILNGTSEGYPTAYIDYANAVGVKDVTFVEGTKDTNPKAKFLNAITEKGDPKVTTIIHSHGSMSHVVVNNHEDFASANLYYDELARALAKRDQKNGTIASDVVCIEACYSGDMAEQMLVYLSEYSNLKNLPLVITSAQNNKVSYAIGFFPQYDGKGFLTVGDIMRQEEAVYGTNDFAFFIPQSQATFNSLLVKLKKNGEYTPTINLRMREPKPSYIRFGR